MTTVYKIRIQNITRYLSQRKAKSWPNWYRKSDQFPPHNDCTLDLMSVGFISPSYSLWMKALLKKYYCYHVTQRLTITMQSIINFCNYMYRPANTSFWRLGAKISQKATTNKQVWNSIEPTTLAVFLITCFFEFYHWQLTKLFNDIWDYVCVCVCGEICRYWNYESYVDLLSFTKFYVNLYKRVARRSGLQEAVKISRANEEVVQQARRIKCSSSV